MPLKRLVTQVRQAEPTSKHSQPKAGKEAISKNRPSPPAGRGLRGASAAGGFPSVGDWRVGSDQRGIKVST
jgi:hypothetical protein